MGPKTFDRILYILLSQKIIIIVLKKNVGATPNTSENIALTIALFNEESAEITIHESKTGKFASISIKELMLDVDSIIEKYENATKIKGLMAL